MSPDQLVFDDNGLVAAVAQDANTGQVRMVAWMNREAVQQTLDTGFAHFWSRSRRSLWRKGETSGNTLSVVDMRPDCDSDAVLLTVIPAGPSCHTGAETCFSDDSLAGFAWLEELNATIIDRIATNPPGSYTASLVTGGVDGPARKVLEEAGELAFAAKDHAQAPDSATEHEVVSEAADLMFHLMVLMAERGIPASALLDELRTRGQ